MCMYLEFYLTEKSIAPYRIICRGRVGLCWFLIFPHITIFSFPFIRLFFIFFDILASDISHPLLPLSYLIFCLFFHHSRWAWRSPLPPGRPAVLLFSSDRRPFWDGQFCWREYNGRPASLRHSPCMYDWTITLIITLIFTYFSYWLNKEAGECHYQEPFCSGLLS